MRKDLLIIALGLFATAGGAGADVVSLPETQTETAIALPAKGSSMSDVTKQFGEPRDKKPTVGGDTPKHPPITRWDYDNFVVIFEKDRVIDAVVPGAPPRLHNTSGLSPAPDAPLPPVAPAAPAAEPIIPEPVPESMAPQEPAAEAAPVMPESPPAPPAETPPPAQAEPQPPVEQMSPAPVESPPPEPVGDGPPTPR